MLLEQKMASCSKEITDIFDSHENRLCPKMLMLKLQVQHQQRAAEDTKHPASKQTQGHKPPDQHHQLNVTRTVQLLVVDALSVPEATWKTMSRPSSFFLSLLFVRTLRTFFVYFLDISADIFPFFDKNVYLLTLLL